MTVYLKKISTKADIFKNKRIEIFSTDYSNIINVPDNIVICNGCNQNIYPEDGVMVYIDKEHLDQDLPYDIYHDNNQCLLSFSSGIRVE